MVRLEDPDTIAVVESKLDADKTTNEKLLQSHYTNEPSESWACLSNVFGLNDALTD